jgi:ankyrin
LLQSVWSAAKERHVRTLASRLRELFLLDEAPCGFRIPSLVRVFLRGRKNFVAEYQRVLANMFPNVSPLILSIVWDDRDVFERLLRSLSKPTPKARPSSKGKRNDRWLEAWHGGLHAVHFAIQHGRMEMLVSLLRAGASIDARTEPAQQTPLHLAIHHRQPKMVALLLDRGATVNIADAGGYAPLHVAAQFDDTAAITLLLDNGADPYARNTKENQPLHVAAALGSANAAAVLVGVEPELACEPGQDGGRPVLFAALKGHAKVVDVLLGAGARPDEPHPSGETPLHLAARGGHEAVVERLLAGGARLDPTVDGITPLFLAAQEGRTRVVQLLLAAGANPLGGRLDPSGMSALHTSAGSGFLDVVQLLVHAGTSVGVTDSDGRTPLHYAAQASSVGGETAGSISMSEGGTEMSMATSIWRCHSADTVSFLLSAGAPVDAVSSSGHTALHIAASVGASDAVQALLSSAANRKLRDTRGLTAADVARRAGFEAIAEAIDAHVEPDDSSATA